MTGDGVGAAEVLSSYSVLLLLSLIDNVTNSDMIGDGGGATVSLSHLLLLSYSLS